MTKPGKTPKKKTKEKSPQRTEESEYPAMDEETYNRLLRNAIEHSKAELEAKLQQQHKEQLKEVEERLTKKFDDEVRELSQAFDESRGASPTTRDKTWMRDIMTEAVVAANNASLHTQKPYIPNRFLDALEEHKYNPYIRGDAQLKLLFIVSHSAPIARAQDKGARIFGPPTLPWLFWRGGAWSGVPGVGARCGNGLFSTYKSPKILS